MPAATVARLTEEKKGSEWLKPRLTVCVCVYLFCFVFLILVPENKAGLAFLFLIQAKKGHKNTFEYRWLNLDPTACTGHFHHH
jgi:hypothetical protein